LSSTELIFGIWIRQRAGDSWFDYLSREFEPCIDALRKDDLPRVRIAVLDTGADLSHPDIAAAVDDGRVQYKDFVSGGPDMIDLSGHGTHCASILLKYALNAEVYIGRIVEQDHTDSSGLERLATVRNSFFPNSSKLWLILT
jgi:subtilisin family serine protease